MLNIILARKVAGKPPSIFWHDLTTINAMKQSIKSPILRDGQIAVAGVFYKTRA
jgi:hypothetical protein